jgi:hypothetical protein
VLLADAGDGSDVLGCVLEALAWRGIAVGRKYFQERAATAAAKLICGPPLGFW